jgi:hypothetical protein
MFYACKLLLLLLFVQYLQVDYIHVFVCKHDNDKQKCS